MTDIARLLSDVMNVWM